MSTFGHRAISASAGTGKTFALAHRYLALMCAGVAPDRICALTFSRKAAGEIFDKIVERLCLCATAAAARAETAANIRRQAPGVAPLDGPGDYLGLLRQLLDHAHRLRIGTLDSFILSVARAFPLELGIPPDAQPMDNEGGEARALRQALLTRLHDPGQRGRDDSSDRAGTALLEAFRQATFGEESKSLTERLDRAVANHYLFFCRHADKAWGDPDRIWPASRWWESAPEPERRAAASEEYLNDVSAAFGGEGRPATLGAACAAVAGAAARHAPEHAWPDCLSETVLRQLLGAACRPEQPRLRYYGRDYALPARLWPPLRAALGNLVGAELTRAARRTAGLRALLGRYDALYGESQRRDGRLTFEDLSRLLAQPAQQPSRRPDTADKLYIDYRLDGQLDHWLLDEFQDTSDTQWGAIANLIDEIVQDPARSFFYVGDVKQSIYGWRGGNRRLFDRVRRQCGIPRDALSECHRSLPAVVDVVNAVFEGLPEWQASCKEDKGPDLEAVTAFMSEWTHHESARRHEGRGFVALIEYPSAKGGREPDPSEAGDGEEGEGEEGEGDPAQYEAVARLLREARPTSRGLSVAVLVRSNEQGRACVDVLRRQLPDLAVVHEGTGGIVDNPVVTLLLALARYAAHPADTLALRHVQMSPLARSFDAEHGGPAGFPARFLADAHARGFSGALRLWGERLGIGDAFGRQRLREFLAAAEEFDAAGSRDADAFADHIRAYQVKAQAAAGAMRVMTIHQSKGLGFDMVLVPFDPSARSFADLRVPVLHSDVGRDEGVAGGWVLQPPKREAMQAAGGAPVDALRAARAEANFEQLCVLYVALTRAKQALYLLVPPRPKDAKALREADLLRDRLAPAEASAPSLYGLPLLHARGDANWFDAAVRRDGGDARLTTAGAPPPLRVSFVPDTLRREPSKDQAENASFAANWLFTETTGDVRAFGLALHRLFERIEWREHADVERIVADWRSECTESPAVVRDVETQFRRCLDGPEVLALLRRPPRAARCDVWREAPFAFVRNGPNGSEIVSGRFDRLVIEQNADGRAVRATVVDFKSNLVETEAQIRQAADGYAGQMRDYAAAAARLLDLPLDRVSACILFTRVARLVTVAGDTPRPD
jgi:ATP-dependent exoDNAse (exonuclease V) beta subunit